MKLKRRHYYSARIAYLVIFTGAAIISVIIGGTNGLKLHAEG